MIYDTLERAGRYAGLHPLFPEAFARISSYMRTRPAPGKTPLHGDDLIAIVAAQGGGEQEFPRLEAHRAYIDIQAALDGEFLVGWRPLAACAMLAQPYDAEKECMLFDDDPEFAVPIGAGRFAVFFPEDAHAPASPEEPLLKVVMKVRIQSHTSPEYQP